MNELTKIYNRLSPARQDRVMSLARALFQEQENEARQEVAAPKRGPGRPRGRKGGTYETTKSVRNSAGKSYKYRVHVTVDASGKRKETYLGRVK